MFVHLHWYYKNKLIYSVIWKLEYTQCPKVILIFNFWFYSQSLYKEVLKLYSFGQQEHFLWQIRIQCIDFMSGIRDELSSKTYQDILFRSQM